MKYTKKGCYIWIVFLFVTCLLENKPLAVEPYKNHGVCTTLKKVDTEGHTHCDGDRSFGEEGVNDM